MDRDECHVSHRQEARGAHHLPQPESQAVRPEKDLGESATNDAERLISDFRIFKLRATFELLTH